ncbi:putative O-antigenpolymerase [Desulfosarcina variabilis str. Montpellier]|uniref:hypothetical protein n=1 Tax=Desulfosarcina variabilis TaxID=2300 RepID=UPI003AFA0CD4
MTSTVFYLYLFLLVFSPPALGRVQFWSLSMFEIVSFTALCLLMLNRHRHGAPLVRVPGLLPLLLFAAYGLFQLIPLPTAMVALISPMNYQFHQQTLGLVQPMAWIPLSLSTRASQSELLRQCAYIAFYVVSVQLLANKRYLKIVLVTSTVFIALLALFTIVGRFNDNGLLPWIESAGATGLFGPWVHHSHMTGLLIMMLPVICALYFIGRPPIRYQTWLRSFTEMIKAPWRRTDALLGLAAGLTWTAILLTRSWPGMIAGCLSMGLLGKLLCMRNGMRQRIMPLALAVGTGLFFMLAGWYGGEPIVDEQGCLQDRQSLIWRDSLKIVGDFPVTGTGIGTFGDIYPAYQTFSGTLNNKFAYNDYLALVATGGPIAVMLMVWFMVSVIRSTYAAFRQRRDKTCRFLYLGATAGVVGIGTFSLLDMGPPIGVNGLYFFFLFSLLVSAAHTRLQVPHQASTSTLEKISVTDFRPFLLLAVGVFALCLLNVVSIIAADRHFRAVAPRVLSEHPILQERKMAIKAHLDAAAGWDPLESRYPLMLARMAEHDKDDSLAEHYYFKALRFFPISSDVLTAYGSFLGQTGQLEMAEQMMLSAIRFARQRPRGYQAYAKWLVKNNRTDEAMQKMREAITRSPTDVSWLIHDMAAWGLSDNVMRAGIPDLAGPCLAFAEHLVARGNTDLAIFYYRKAVAAEAGAKRPTADPFVQAHRFYVSQNRWLEALQVLQQGVDILPQNVTLRLALANAYEHQGITYRAEEEYRQALIINPKSFQIKAAIDRLAGS